MNSRHYSWHYWAFGLHIASEVQITGFLPQSKVQTQESNESQTPDVVINIEADCAPSDFLSSEVLQEAIAVRITAENSIDLYVKKIGLFKIDAGQQVQIIPDNNATHTQQSLALSGVVMAAVLYQRKNFVAHGSAIAIQDKAVLFLGDSGAGKSSLALAFHQHQCPVITDDLASIHLHDHLPFIHPALPQIRTTEETAQHLNLDWANLSPIPGLAKRYLNFEADFETEALPVAQIYILKNADEITIQDLTGQQKMMELMHHSEVMHLFSQNQSQHFLSCASLASKVPIQTLQRPKDWAHLDTVITTIQEQISAS